MLRSWKLDDDHSATESENGISLQFGPIFGISHGRQECIWAFRVEKCGLDTLCIVRWWNCRVVVPFRSQGLSNRICRFAWALDECLFEFPGELCIGVVHLILASCLCCRGSAFSLGRFALDNLCVLDWFGGMLA